MSELPIGSGSTGTPIGDARWELVQRILASRHFQKAPQLREILLYLCRRALENGPITISEHEIGCNVLGRRPDFNSSEDNIVRVQVRHLRKKLEEYFATDGLEEPLILVVPKGTYVPHFEPLGSHSVRQTSAHPDNGHAELPSPAPITAAPRSASASHLWAVVALLSLLSVGLAITAFVFWRQTEAGTASTSRESGSPAGDALWSKVFAPGQEVTCCRPLTQWGTG